MADLELIHVANSRADWTTSQNVSETKEIRWTRLTSWKMKNCRARGSRSEWHHIYPLTNTQGHLTSVFTFRSAIFDFYRIWIRLQHWSDFCRIIFGLDSTWTLIWDLTFWSIVVRAKLLPRCAVEVLAKINLRWLATRSIFGRWCPYYELICWWRVFSLTQHYKGLEKTFIKKPGNWPSSKWQYTCNEDFTR